EAEPPLGRRGKACRHILDRAAEALARLAVRQAQFRHYLFDAFDQRCCNAAVDRLRHPPAAALLDDRIDAVGIGGERRQRGVERAIEERAILAAGGEERDQPTGDRRQIHLLELLAEGARDEIL